MIKMFNILINNSGLTIRLLITMILKLWINSKKYSQIIFCKVLKIRNNQSNVP